VAAAPPPADRHLLYGVAAHAWWLDQHLDRFVAAYHDLGVTTLRLSIDWKRIEPTPGEYQWQLYDRVLNRLVDEGFTIVGVFVTVPAWAASDTVGCAIEQHEPRACDLPEARRADFERVVRATVGRYPFIRHWEFWNEPELWLKIGQDVGHYLPWLRRFYAIAHEVDPEVMVAAGTLAGWEYIGWLYATHSAYYGAERRPWDAIALHPYNTVDQTDDNGQVLALRYNDIERLRAGMVEQGDSAKPIWITEYGWEVAAGLQAQRLSQAMRWLKRQPYITFAHLHMLHDWERERFGLMATEPDIYGRQPIDATTRFVPKEPFYGRFKRLPRPGRPVAPAGLAAPTGQISEPVFQAIWQADAEQWCGQPLTRAHWRRRSDGGYALSQYFERCRLEWHRPVGVERGLLGDEFLQRHGWLDNFGQPLVDATRPRPVREGSDELYFAATGHGLSGDFRRAWEVAGGLASLGYPRTDVLEQQRSDGRQWRYQITQRGLLEQPIEPTGQGVVRLARLGSEALQAAGWLDGAERPTDRPLNPAARRYR
jgi:hypothetical protein